MVERNVGFQHSLQPRLSFNRQLGDANVTFNEFAAHTAGCVELGLPCLVSYMHLSS